MNEYFNQIINWLYDNKDWVFSGIGVTVVVSVIGFILKFFKKETKNKSVRQNASFNIGCHIMQVNGDIKSKRKSYE